MPSGLVLCSLCLAATPIAASDWHALVVVKNEQSFLACTCLQRCSAASGTVQRFEEVALSPGSLWASRLPVPLLHVKPGGAQAARAQGHSRRGARAG
eukprot:6180683-Pleurochrysis_carterae.AAC.3